MNVSPASAVQVTDAGELIEVSDDVLGIAREIRELHPDFHLRFSEKNEFWAVFQVEHHPLTGELLKKQLVTTSKGRELNPQIVLQCKKVLDPNYDFLGELHELEKHAKRDARHSLRESIGERAERLAHAIRKDTHRNQRRIFIPRGLPV